MTRLLHHGISSRATMRCGCLKNSLNAKVHIVAVSLMSQRIVVVLKQSQHDILHCSCFSNTTVHCGCFFCSASVFDLSA